MSNVYFIHSSSFLIFITNKVRQQRLSMSLFGKKKASNKAIVPPPVNKFNNENFFDIKVSCGDEVYHCQSLYLIRGSERFEDIIRTEMEDVTIFIDDAKPDVIRLMLQYLHEYDIQKDIRDNEIRIRLFEVASKFAVHTLKESLMESIVESINNENVFHLFALGENEKNVELVERCLSFIKKDKKKLINSKTLEMLFSKKPDFVLSLIINN